MFGPSECFRPGVPVAELDHDVALVHHHFRILQHQRAVAFAGRWRSRPTACDACRCCPAGARCRRRYPSRRRAQSVAVETCTGAASAGAERDAPVRAGQRRRMHDRCARRHRDRHCRAAARACRPPSTLHRTRCRTGAGRYSGVPPSWITHERPCASWPATTRRNLPARPAAARGMRTGRRCRRGAGASRPRRNVATG